jgi:branched-chain amino acid aminotransferase
MKMSELVFVNGKAFKPEEAKISVFDRGFLFGDAVYEVARSYGRVFLELEPHISRMFNSANLIGLDLQKTEDEYIREIYQCYKSVPLENMYMRIQITRGEGNIGLGTANANKPNVIIYFRHLEKLDPKLYDVGGSIVTSSRIRNSKKALDPNIKSGNYLNNVLAYMDASKSKALESILINSQGLITEGTTSNIFSVKNGVLITPPVEFDILQGITRKIVIGIAHKLKIPVKEAGITPSELENSDEVFLTSSTREVLPIHWVNGKVIGNEGYGPVTKLLALTYKDHVKQYCEQKKEKYGALLQAK